MKNGHFIITYLAPIKKWKKWKKYQFCVKWIVCESFHTPQKFADHGIPSLFMVRYSSLHFQLDELISISIFCDRFESKSVPFNLENG